MKKKIIVIIYLLINLYSSISFSQSSLDSSSPSQTLQVMKVQQEFNRNLISEMTSDLMTNPIVGWNSGGLVKVIFSICFIIALAQALSNSNPTGMVTEMTKLAFYSWLIVAMLGGPTYQRFSFLSTPYDNYTSNSSLDVDIFNFAAYHADKLADQLFQASGPQKLVQASDQNKAMTENFINARKYCTPGDGDCFKKFLKKGKVDPKVVLNLKDESKGFSLTPDSLSYLAELALKAYGLFSDLTLTLFYFLSWAVDIIRSAMNMFVMITFGIITGVSFFLMKFIFPFALIPKYRGQVLRAVKVPLSATLYGLATSLIVYVSAVGFTAMNTAATNTMIDKFASGSSTLETLQSIQSVQLSMITGMLIFSILQVIAIAKIPKLCRDLLNLSFDSFVGFAQEAVMAGVSIATAVGSAVATGGMSVAGGLAGKAMGSISGSASAFGQKLGFLPKSGLAGKGFNSGDSGGSAPGGMSPATSSSVSGIDIAQESAIQPRTTTSTIASSVANENMVSPNVKSPDKTIKLSKKDMQKNELVAKGFAPNASSEDREKALQQIIGKREKKDSLLGKLVSSSMKIGAGDSSEFNSLVRGGMSSATENITNFIDDTSESIANPELAAQRKEKIREAKIEAGLDPDDPSDPDNMSFFKRGVHSLGNKLENNSFYKNVKFSHQKSKEKVLGAFNYASSLYGGNSVSENPTERSSVIEQSFRTATRQDKMSLNQKTIDKINENENLSSLQRDELIKYKTNFNLDEKSNQVIESKLNKEMEKSSENIAKGSGTEDDFSLMYRSKNLDFNDSSQILKSQELIKENEEFKKYSELKDTQYKNLVKELSSVDIQSQKGSELLEQASKLTESGYISSEDYRRIVGQKAEEFNRIQEEERGLMIEREKELLQKQKEKQEKIIQKLKMDDENLIFEHDSEKYHFGINNKNNVSDQVFLKNGETSDKFSELNKEFIASLSSQVESMTRQVNIYNESSDEFKTVSKERHNQLMRNISIIQQIIDIYNKKNK